ncbi:Eukaryotic translation initiation factor 3 subunit J [Dillenia turbinata]|uniref:Eukaryotic translation initiation factor 3 subunit J n=1 Tax=Dillenia turbinata TaxID=194707 RepID=A0AAN8UKI3_9MAGN
MSYEEGETSRKFPNVLQKSWARTGIRSKRGLRRRLSQRSERESEIRAFGLGRKSQTNLDGGCFASSVRRQEKQYTQSSNSYFFIGPEDEQIPPLPNKEQPKNKWDDEDVDDNDVKESWEDEDPAPAPVAEPRAEKAPKKPAAKTAEMKGKTVEVAKEVPLDPVAEKLRQQRLVEEADFRSTTELFGKRGDEKSLDNFIPKSESDFLEYAELVSHKLQPYEKSFHYIGLLKAVMRLSMTTLKAADAKDVASSITAIANEKLKAEKEANAGKKKTGTKKKQLHVDKEDDDLVINAYEALDDYDFM